MFEQFPVGRRLAFDAAKGRLWVVCPACERWNLSPLEERWETIEHAERLYRDTRKRVATDNIGLAKLGDGTTIVRVGSPLRPEFAAWRYGDQFGRRRTRQLLLAGGGLLAVGGVAFAGLSVMGTVAVSFMGLGRLGAAVINGRPNEVVARIPIEGHDIVSVRRRHLAETTLSRADDGSMAIDLRFKNGQGHFEGRDAERIAAIVIPKVNRFGGTKDSIAAAVQEIESVGGPDAYLAELTRVAAGYTRRPTRGIDRHGRWRGGSNAMQFEHGLFGLPRAHRLALEMALHEEAERRALEGELGELERAWREAEEIAGISDTLFVAPEVDVAMERLKGKTDIEKV